MPREAPSLRGGKAEARACAYLQARGLELLARNFRTRNGEIDLVMRDRTGLVFVEVRYRRSTAFGTASETVTATKQARVRHAAEHFLHQHPAYRDCACRFDVVACDEEAVEWLVDAFQ